MKSRVFALLLIVVSSGAVCAQTNLTVDIDDPVYLLIEMAEVRGIVTRVSQVRPFPVTQIKAYLEEIYGERSRLTAGQLQVLEEQRRRFGLIVPDERKWYASGRGNFGGPGTEMENFPMRLRLEINSFNNAELNSGAFQTVNPFELFWEGDASKYLSYSFNVGFGAAYLNPGAFAPFFQTSYSEGFVLGLDGSLNDSTVYNGFGVSFHFQPELMAQFLQGKIRLGMGRYSRSMGTGSAGLTLSQHARPYDAIELAVRPAKWMNFYFSVGSLGNWFSYRTWVNTDVIPTYPTTPDYGTTVDDKNLTLQVLEFFPLDWLYLNFTTGAVWGKRSEIGYFNPLMPLLFAQNLYGDADNMAFELTLAFPIPIGLKLYGTFFSDEVQFNDLGSLFTDTSQQFAIQAGLKGLIPGLGFTMGTLQYTKLEPYVYTHYEQVYAHSTALVNTNWTNDRYNLGYYLPPNSDEFLVQVESLPFRGLKVFGAYRYIRHGYGDWNNGEIEGTVTSGGDYAADTVTPPPIPDERHAYQGRTKDFLHDGPYERLHMVTVGGEYQFPKAPFLLGLEYTFSYAVNDGLQEDRNPGNVNSYSAWLPYSGMRNAVSFHVKVYPEY